MGLVFTNEHERGSLGTWIPFFLGVGCSCSFSTPTISASFPCLSFREPLKWSPLWTPPYSLTALLLHLWLPLSRVLFLANSNSPFKTRLTCQLPCSLPWAVLHAQYLLCAYFFEVFKEKPGHDLVSHTRCAQCEHNQCLVNKGNQFKWKVTNTGLWIAICFFLAHLWETVNCLREWNPRWFIFASFTQHLALCLVHSRC